jgi:hypothetical protein
VNDSWHEWIARAAQERSESMNDLPLPPPDFPDNCSYTDTSMLAYARQYGAMVQERCAQICEELSAQVGPSCIIGDDRRDAGLNVIEACAAAIRANKEAT